MKIYVTTGSCRIETDGSLCDLCVETDPVGEPLAITQDVLLMRGESILRKLAYNWIDIKASGNCIDAYETGQIVMVTGTGIGNFVGKIVSVSYTDDVESAASVVALGIKIIK